MLENFLSFLDSIEFEDSGLFTLLNAEWQQEKFTVTLNIADDYQPEIFSNWQIVCSGVRKQFLRFGVGYNFDFSQNHILLWEFSKGLCSVSFNGKTKNSEAVIGSLYRKHAELTENWFPFHHFLNMEFNLVNLISGGYGLLASAPEPLALGYKEVMTQHGFSASCSEPRFPNYWNGELWTDEITPVSVMIFDDSYIIAESFEAEKF